LHAENGKLEVNIFLDIATSASKMTPHNRLPLNGAELIYDDEVTFGKESRPCLT
jgi:hypothetical protein